MGYELPFVFAKYCNIRRRVMMAIERANKTVVMIGGQRQCRIIGLETCNELNASAELTCNGTQPILSSL